MSSLCRALLRLYPLEFRAGVGLDLLETVQDRIVDRRASAGRLAGCGQGLKELLGLASGGLRMRWSRWCAQAFQAPASTRRAVVSAFRQDLLLAIRASSRAAGFTTTVILTFAIGIGGIAAVFSVVDGAFVRPLPYPDARALVTVWNRFGDGPDARQWVHDLQVRDLRGRAETLADVAAVTMVSGRILGGSRPIHTDVARVSTNFFDVLGVEPHLGRSFETGDDAWQAPWIVLLSHDYWKHELRGDSTIVGEQIKVGWRFMEIVGVLPATFDFRPHESVGERVKPDLWIPHQVNYERLQVATPGVGVAVLARLSEDASLAEAKIELAELASSQVERWFEAGDVKFEVSTLRAELTHEVRPVLTLLVVCVGFVLLLVIANIAMLVSARTDARREELAVRRALGASRARIARQLTTENLLLALIGGGFGLLFAQAGTRVLVQLAPLDVPLEASVGLDRWALGFALISTMLAGLASGVVPVWRSRRAVPLGTIFGRRRRPRSRSRRAHGGLVVAQVALSVMLLVGAGLTTVSLSRLIAVDPGFEPEQALTFSVHLMDEYGTPDRHAAFYRELNARLWEDPDVIAVGGTSALPLAEPHAAPVFRDPPGVRLSSYVLPGHGFEPEVGFDPGVDWWMADHNAVTEGYFAAAGTELLDGRGFRTSDVHDGPLVIVVDRAMADAVWPEADPMGRRLWATNEWRTVVGVASGSNHHGLGKRGPPQVYYPVSQVVVGRISMIVRSRTELGRMSSRVWRTVGDIDPLVPIGDVRPLRWMRDRELAPARFVSSLLIAFASAGAAVAAVGLFAILSYTAGRRRREAAIRRTLGSAAADTARVVIGYGMKLTAAGVVVGLVAALGLARLLARFLYGVQANDSFVLLGAAVVSLGIGFLACWIPARRATLTDPLAVLVSD